MSAAPVLALAAAGAVSLLGLLFLRAVWHKLADFGRFAGFVDDYRLLPAALVEPAARGLIALEALTLGLLPWPATVKVGALLAVLLLALYAGAITLNLWRGRLLIECGCGGAGQTLSPALVLRNLMLIALAGLPLIHGVPPLAFSEAAAAVAAGLLLFLSLLVVEQLLANDGHIRATRHAVASLLPSKGDR